MRTSRLSRDRDSRVRATVAGLNNRLTEEMVQRLLRDRSANVRWHLLTNFPLRRDIAEALSNDPDEVNAAQARNQLARQRSPADSW